MSGEHPTTEGRYPVAFPTGEDTKGSAEPKVRRAWKPAFLRALRVSGNVSAACRAARIGRRRVYTCFHTQPKFRRAWEAAIEEATDALEAEARRRAVDGVPTPVYHAGVQVGTIVRYSDALLARLLQAYRPERFADRKRDAAVGSVVVQVATAPPAGELAITAADIEAARRLLDQHQRPQRLVLPADR